MKIEEGPKMWIPGEEHTYMTCLEPQDLHQHIPRGWVPLVLRLAQALYELGWTGGVEKIEPVYGSLKFKWINNLSDPWRPWGQQLVEIAEEESRRTCQVCGTAGRLKSDQGELATLCDEHFKGKG